MDPLSGKSLDLAAQADPEQCIDHKGAIRAKFGQGIDRFTADISPQTILSGAFDTHFLLVWRILLPFAGIADDGVHAILEQKTGHGKAVSAVVSAAAPASAAAKTGAGTTAGAAVRSATAGMSAAGA